MQPSLTLLSPLDATSTSRLTSVLRRRLPDTEVHALPVDEKARRLPPDVTDGVVLPLALTPTPGLAGGADGLPIAALGPHPLLAAAMVQQLEAAGARRGDAAVLVAEESPTSQGLLDALTAGKMLQSIWGAPVRVAHLRGRGRRVHELVPELIDQGHKRIVAASYVLSEGPQQRQVIAHATTSGCAAVSGPLGTHPLFAELIVRHYRAALQSGSVAKVA